MTGVQTEPSQVHHEQAGLPTQCRQDASLQLNTAAHGRTRRLTKTLDHAAQSSLADHGSSRLRHVSKTYETKVRGASGREETVGFSPNLRGVAVDSMTLVSVPSIESSCAYGPRSGFASRQLRAIEAPWQSGCRLGLSAP